MESFLQFALGAGPLGSREDLCITLDFSPSMDEKDLDPTRRVAAISATDSLLRTKSRECQGDRVAIVVFGGVAKIALPLTPIHEVSSECVDGLLRRKPITCTDIIAALETSKGVLNEELHPRRSGLLTRLVEFMADDPEKPVPAPHECRKRIVLLSDGKHHAIGSPVRAAQRIKNAGVEIDVVGIGGSPTAKEFDERTLKQIASTRADGSPRYCFIRDTESLIREFEQLSHHIRPMDTIR